MPSSFGVADARHAVQRRDELVPEAALPLQHLAALGGQLVEAAAALARFLEPPALDETALLEAVEHRVERGNLEADGALRARFDQLADLVPVPLPVLQQRQDQHLGA